MKKLTFLTAIILSVITATAQIINIPADYPTIQEGINAAEEGDTVLVQPGTYYENIRIYIDITVASLFLTTEDPSYITQTVIDGGQQDHVVYFGNSADENTLLCGFTISNGNSSQGGGIHCHWSNPILKNLVITENTATWQGGLPQHSYGGGIYCDRADPTLINVNIQNNSAITGGGIYCSYQSNPTLKNVKIAYNNADKSGGGIYFANDTYATFDTTERCNIYLNNAKEGSDLYGSYGTDNMEIVVDTFTVLHPTRYHVTSREKNDKFLFDIIHGKIEQVNNDLYVSPDGDDNNTGLNVDEPLKTIYAAYYRILPDSTNPHTIHLAGGTYSEETNGEVFPVVLLDNIQLKGVSKNSVILDADSTSGVITEYMTEGTGISDMTITGGMATEGGGIYSGWSSPTLKNLTILNNHASGDHSWDGGGGIYFFSAEAIVENVLLTNNTAISKGGGICIRNNQTVILKNTTIKNNSASDGGGLFIGADVIFDSIERCNIYYNTANAGNDLFTDRSNKVFEVFVDTFSVLHPTNFYAEPGSSFTFDILNGKIEQVNADLFVSPDGDNNNSGLTEEEPLQTIHQAFGKILADSSNPHTIHLLEGTYSPSANGELFPINMIDYISLDGTSREDVILDAESLSHVVKFNGVIGANISNLTITGGKGGELPDYGGGINCLNSNPVLENLNITDNISLGSYGNGGGIYCDDSDPVLINVDITNNTAELGGGIYCNSDCDLTLQDVNINGNTAEEGGGIYDYYNSTISLQNVTLSNNTADETGGGAYFRGADVDLQDVTIMNNTAANGGGLCFWVTVASFDKVIVSNNTSDEQGGGMYVQGTIINFKSVNITNNAAGEEGGGIYVTGGGSNINFDSINRCNIFLNYARKWGRDLYSGIQMDVIVDTFTVNFPGKILAYPLSNFQFDIKQGLFEQVDADLFVSPEGDNQNSGLTAEEPLKDISMAIIKIIPDTTQRTIHLLEGIYSNSGTDEIFPLYMPEHIDIMGVSRDNVVLDAKGQSNVVYFDVNNQSKLSTLTVKGGNNNGIHCYHSTPILENLLITENEHTGISFDNNAHATLNNISITNNAGSGIFCDNSSHPVIDQLVVSDNGGRGIRLSSSNPIVTNASISNNGGGISCSSSSPKLTNITISDNAPYSYYGYTEGGGIYCNNSHPEIENVIISGNTAATGGGIYCTSSNPKLTDVSIVENESSRGGGIFLRDSDPLFSNVNVFDNSANEYGGGIYFQNSNGQIFDSISRSNIYLNSALIAGTDLYSDSLLHVIVDTFTVKYPTNFHTSPIQNFSFDIHHGLLEQVDADLFVSPDGDNNNSGLTSEEPLKNIRYGYAKLIADSLHPRTVHLLEGVYSPSNTGETFPIIIPKNINLSGSSKNDVILDAEKQSGVIYVYQNPDAKISGLTAINGTNSGIQLYGSFTELKNLTVRNNDGGGIYCNHRDTSTLINVSIYNNQGNNGGGINCSNNSLLIFDETERCNIYNNRAKYNGNDLYTSRYLKIFADTFSVLNPKNFHASPIESFALNINYGRFEQTNEDLYISPGGNNTNSGLTEENPIQNIHTARSKSLADSLHPQTFYLAEGVYSPSASNEFYPVVLDDYISIEGAGAGKTILDADSLPESVIRIDEKMGISISKLTITGGGASGVRCFRSDPVIQNVRITANSASSGGGIYFTYSDLVLKNIVIDNNLATGFGWYNNGYGGGLFFYESNPTLLNVSIMDNEAVYGGGGIYISPHDLPSDVNHTEIINSIIWNNLPDQAYVESWSPEDSISLNISWSDIMDGEEGIVSWDTTAVHWLEGNINEDPLFVNIGNFPYALSDYSPCVDAGTLDTTGLNLTEMDILGYTRIWNERIDMGAVEWNSLGVEESEVGSLESGVESYPNPFSVSTTIAYTLAQRSFVMLEVIDVDGQVMERLVNETQDKGEQEASFNAASLPPGVYVCVLITENGIQATKMIKLR